MPDSKSIHVSSENKKMKMKSYSITNEDRIVIFTPDGNQEVCIEMSKMNKADPIEMNYCEKISLDSARRKWDNLRMIGFER